MKTFVTFAGGHPWYWDDLIFTQLAYKEALQGAILTTLAGGSKTDPVLMFGLVVTSVSPTERHISSGWVFWQGKLRRVPEKTVYGSNPYLILQPATVNITSKTYADSSTHFVYIDEILDVSSAATIGLPGVAYFEDLVLLGAEDWHIIGTPGEPAWGAGYEGFTGGSGLSYVSLSFRKTWDGWVDFRGALSITSLTTDVVLFTMPVGYRPATDKLLGSVYNDGQYYVQVTPDGEVKLVGSPGIPTAVGTALFWDGLRYDL